MRTQKQIAASRENGGKSHGAATAEGKARIVNANLQTGIFAETQVLIWEFQEDLQELKDEYYARHPPASPEARCLLDQIVMCEWHLRRFDWVEGSLWDKLFTASPQDSTGAPMPSSKATRRSPGSSTASTPPAAPSTPR